jgi:CBS domain-containing protein
MQISTKHASTKPFLKLTAADLMSKPIVTVPYDMLLRDAGYLLMKQAISGAPVVDAEGNCVGVLSAADFIAPAEPEAGQMQTDISFVAPWGEVISLECCCGCVVRDYMTAGPVAVSPQTPIGQIAEMMIDAHIHRVLVAENNRPCGIVSSTDLMAAIAGAARKRSRRQSNVRSHNTSSREDPL